MRKISKKIRIQSVKDYRGGMSLRQVAEKNGVSQESVRRWAGYKTRPRGTKYAPSNPNQISLIPMPSGKRRFRESPFKVGIKNANKRWTKLDDEMLRDAVLDNMTVEETKDLLGRTEASIYSRKTILIDRGFIDENLRFPVPHGVKRERPVRVKESKEETSEINSKSITIDKIGLNELAQIVKQYGVGVTLSVTQEGTEIKVHV